jgi:tetratricopeptide (TPR) repeat protein
MILFGGNTFAQDSNLSYYAERTLRDYYTGSYAEAEKYAERIIEAGVDDPDVTTALIKAELAQGKYQEAAATAAVAAETFSEYFPIQVLAIEALLTGGKEDEAKLVLEKLNTLAKNAKPKALNSIELVALGKAALLLGGEPKMVLTQFFQKARKLDPGNLGAHLAAAELAIKKADYALASKILGEARTKVGPFPDILHQLARAYSPSDRVKSEQLLELAYERNPRHVPSMILQAEHLIDAEDYALARTKLDEAFEINPNHPQAWAYLAAIAHLRDETEDAKKAREKALAPWKKNPQVDFWIGTKVSQKRRFDEGSEYLRKALAFDPDHQAAKTALGQNLLRLGDEEEGWNLIKEVQEKDKYNVETYNLMLLHDELEKFELIQVEHFAVRMTPEEAAIYGPQVLALLERASKELCPKYGYTPEKQVVVDFFPDQQDFAIRTLGIPGGLGIVGACFGNAIAMNSPGSAGAMGTNWESTLWHEFCHTVTLGATRNRIPRWLTEGISVYEERLRDPACGSKMTSEFRRRILKPDGLIPIGNLSSALLAFSEPGTISFAYYQSSLLIEYILETYGESALREILDDLRENAVAEKSLERRLTSLDELESGFTKFAVERARKVAPLADWEIPDEDSPLHRDPEGIAAFLKENPNNIWALAATCSYHLSERQWPKVIAPAKKLIELHPDFIGGGNGYIALARAQRNLEDTAGERQTLRELAKRDSDAIDAFIRLIDLDLDAKDWPSVEESSRRLLALNPMLRSPHGALGIAAQEQQKKSEAIAAFTSLLRLDPVNPADVHFRLAQLHSKDDARKAKRHLLMALEEAPRFRAAHTLLLELAEDPAPPKIPAPTPTK